MLLKFKQFSVNRVPIYIDSFKIAAVTPSRIGDENECVVIYTTGGVFYVEGGIDEIVRQIQDAI